MFPGQTQTYGYSPNTHMPSLLAASLPHHCAGLSVRVSVAIQARERLLSSAGFLPA